MYDDDASYGSHAGVALWGSGTHDVWVGGSRGDVGTFPGFPPDPPTATLHHFDGTTWSAVTLPNGLDPAPTSIAGVWGTGASDVWAAAPPYGLLHFDGTSWAATPLTSVPSAFVGVDGGPRSVWGSDACHVWAAGGTTLWEGTPAH